MWSSSGSIFAAANDAVGVSFVIGFFTPGFLASIGLVKCLSIARRPTTNAKCVHCLSLLLVTWLVATAVSAVRRFAPDSPLVPLLCLIGALISVPLLMTAIFLGALGLAELHDDRHGRYTQGRVQAILGLTLCTIPIVCVAIMTVAGLTQLGPSGMSTVSQRDSTRAAPSQTASGPSTQDESNASTVKRTVQPRRDGSSVQIRRVTANSPNEVRFPSLNFVFRPPDRPWVKIDIKRFTPDAIVGYARENPPMYLAIIAQKMGGSFEMDSAALAESAKFNLRSRIEDSQCLEERPYSVNGLDGVWLTSRAQLDNLRASYVHWVCARNGYAYQLVFWSERQHESRVRDEAERLVKGFDMLDRGDAAQGGSFAALEDFRSESFGIEIRLRSSGWTAASNELENQPGVEFAAVHSPSHDLSVIPIWLMGHRPGLEALTKAYLSGMGIPYPTRQIYERQGVQDGTLNGHEFSYRHGLGQSAIAYRFRILLGEDFAYCVVVRAARPGGVDRAIFEDIVKRVQIREPARDRAPALLSPRQRRHHALVFNELGIHFLQVQQPDESQECFKTAADLDPDDPVILSNLVATYRRNGCNQEALEILEGRLSKFPDRMDLRATRAAIELALEKTAEAIEHYDAVFASGWENDEHLQQYVGLLCQSGATDRALAVVDARSANNDALWLTALRARIMGERGEIDQAIALLRNRVDRSAHDPEIIRGLIDLYQKAEQPGPALQLIEGLIADGVASAEMLYLKGEVEFSLKRYRESLESLEAALRMAPDNETIQRAVAIVTATLGRGSSQRVRTPIAPVDLPAELTQPPAPMPAPAQVRDASAYYADRLTAIEYEPTVSYRISIRQSICILNEHGVSQFSTIRVPFDPLSEDLFVNRLDVFDRTGNLVASGNAVDYYVMDDSSNDTATHRKVLNIPVPGLQPGHRIELLVTTRDRVVPEQLPFRAHTFCSTIPCTRDVLYVRAPQTTLLCCGPNAPTPQRIGQGLLWKLENVPALRHEPLQDDVTTFLPIVYLGDQQSTWKTAADSYLELIAERLPVPPETERLARELTRDVSDERARMLTLARHVQREYSYKAIEFGRRSLQMNASSDTIRNKYGDCKDHSLLLFHLLRTSGIPARLALVNSSGQLYKEIPSLDQFDHMVVFVDGPGGGHCFDTTDKSNDVALQLPPGLAGKEIFVLDAEQSHFVKLDEGGKQVSVVDISRRVSLEPMGRMRVNETMVFRGYYAGAMRAYLKSIDPAQHKASWQAALDNNGNRVRLIEVDIQNLGQTESPLVLNSVLRIEDAWKDGNELMVTNLPILWESGILGPEHVEDRRTPWRLVMPLRLNVSVLVEPPTGYACRASEPRQGATEFVQWQASSKPVNEGLRISCTAARAAGHFGATSYETYYNSMCEARRAFSPTLTFYRNASTATRSATNQPQISPDAKRRK